MIFNLITEFATISMRIIKLFGEFMYNWREKRLKKAVLALENGEVFSGWSFGAAVDVNGEVVFNTGMTGYEEIVSDPSYAGQFVALTAAEIGNYGTNARDMESRKLFLNGLVIQDLNYPSNYRSEKPLDVLLKEYGVPGIGGIDMRRLTKILRSEGTQKAFMHCSDKDMSGMECVKAAGMWRGLDGLDYASQVSVDKPYLWNESGVFNVTAVDFGIKYGILRRLEENDMRVTVVPAVTSAENILKMKPDGVVLSNGPADPGAVRYAMDCVKALVGKVPLMGICLGHQLFGIAMGAGYGRLKFGHHGCNHPVKNLLTGNVEITSQNHNFALEADRLPSCLELTHINLNDGTVEGVRHRSEPAFGVQYHPEAAPGPNDSAYLFAHFKEIMGR